MLKPRLHSTLLACSIAAAVAVACSGGGGGTTTVVRTVAPAVPSPTVAPSGVDEVDRIARSAVAGDVINLAALTGYAHVPCTTSPPSSPKIGDPPPCEAGQADGRIVEALPVTGCGPGWAQPIDAVGAYRVALAGRGVTLDAVYVPQPGPSPTGAAYREQYVVVIKVDTGTGARRDVALHIFGGRVVWVETACPPDADLAATSRAQSFLVGPAATTVTPAATPTP